MKIIPEPDDDDRDDEEPAPREPEELDDHDKQREAETMALRLVLSAVCNGHHTRAVMAALSLTLQAVVVEVSEDGAAIEAFTKLFGDALRKRWLFETAGDEGEVH